MPSVTLFIFMLNVWLKHHSSLKITLKTIPDISPVKIILKVEIYKFYMHLSRGYIWNSNLKQKFHNLYYWIRLMHILFNWKLFYFLFDDCNIVNWIFINNTLKVRKLNCFYYNQFRRLVSNIIICVIWKKRGKKKN